MGITILWLSLTLSLICSLSWAEVKVVRFPSGTGVSVADSKCGGTGCGANLSPNVGIGTSVPRGTLDVNGSFIIEGAGTGKISGPNGIGFDPNNVIGGTFNPVMTLATSYNIGIGTGNTAPAAQLHVLGTTFLSTGPNFSSPELSFDANGNFFPVIYTPSGSTDSILKIGASSDKNTNASAAILSIDVDTNNVGIGTEIPAAKFYVNGTTRTTNLTIGSIATGTQCLQANASGVVSGTGAGCGGAGSTPGGGANAVQYNNGSTFAGLETLLSENGTNIGIGTTNGQNLLDVQGAVTARALEVTSAGNVGIGSKTPGQLLDVKGTVRSIQLVVNGFDQNATSAGIDVRDSTKASLFFVGNDGSVGIGTYNTINTVDIMQSGDGFQPILDLRDYNNVNSDTRVDLKHAEGTVTSPLAVADGDYLGGVGFWGYANGNFRQSGLFECRVEGTPSGSTIPSYCHVMTTNIASGEREVFKINPNGNVGIGVSSPGQILDAAGTVRATGFILTGNGAAAGFILQSNGSLGVGTWVPSPTGGGGSGTVNSGTANQVAYYASSTTAVSGSSALVVTGASSGNNVGIGSATPGSLLDVQGTMRVLGAGSSISVGSANPGGYLDIEGTLLSVVIFGVSAGSTAKNVGIGSYTPGQMLDVAGAGRFLGTGNTQLNTASGNVGIGTTLSLNKLDVAGAVSIGTTYAGYQTASANGMIIQGNVGINSINPNQKLEVQGTIRMLGITSFAGNNIKASIKAAANQACNTTCTSGGCLFGFDTGLGGSDVVDCADATADRCECLDGAGG